MPPLLSPLTKQRLLLAALVASSLVGYLEWGHTNSTFLLAAEWHIVQQLWADPVAMLHPLVVLPMLGQVLLVAAFVRPQPSRILVYAGVGCIGLLLVVVLLVGLLSRKPWIVLSTLPFFVFVIATIRYLRKHTATATGNSAGTPRT